MEYKLKELTTKITKGTTPSNIGEDFSDSGVMYFRSELLGKSKYIDKSEGLLYITEEVHNKLKRSQIEKNDILFSMAGIYLGKISLVGDDDYPANTNQAVAIIRLKPNVCNLDYLYYYMTQKWFTVYVNSRTAQAAQPNINLEQIGNLKIELPSIDIQNKVANILSRYDELIENNNKRIKLLEQMAENLYKEWFVHFRFPDYEAVNFEEKKPFGWIVSSCENTKIPSCFDYCEFSELGSFTRGRNITAAEMVEGEIPVISAGLQPSGYHNKANVTGRSLTISASGANAGYLQYNLSDIWAADCSYYQNEKNLWFVYCTLKFLQPVISNLQCGAAQPHVYPKNINKLCVLKPTDELIVKFNQTVEPFFDEIETLKKKNDNLTKQRDLLLPRLMSGKLEV